ncbi:cytochrome p450 [Stygiomarasmius scandens]|uniref:Cytochrome p450 n=1 Tax=Marasmiellus scandens TaxID=2682957 RepID=A0ABR1J2V4_9AGAR
MFDGAGYKFMGSVHLSDALKLLEASAPRIISLFTLLCTFWLISTYSQKSKRLSYPPGPKGPWYFGLSKFPTKKPWLTYIEWEKQYGDLIHFSRFGKHYVVINSLKAANEILGRNARFTSSRPSTSGLDQIAQWERFLGMTSYGDEWRKNRKLFHQNFRAEAAVQFRPIQKLEVEKFILGLVSSQLPLRDQIETLSQKIMFNAVYGLDISSNKDDLPHHARELLENIESVLIPGWDAFKYLPCIDLLPSWLPGGKWRVSYQVFQQEFKKLCEGPWALMMNSINSKEDHSDIALIPRLISMLESDASGTEIERLKNMGGQAVGAAADTTMSAISTFWLAMSLYPDVQKKAHKELDNVLGPGKLPDFNDRSSLPYIEAIYREVMRWHPAIPMGV